MGQLRSLGLISAKAGQLVMEDATTLHRAWHRQSPRAARRLAYLLLVPAILVTGCKTYVGTTAQSFLRHVRENPDPNIRYIAYGKLASPSAYDSSEQKDAAVKTLIEKYKQGKEPLATRAVICRTLGELGDPRARPVILSAIHDPEPILKIEACHALGKVGQPEDATVLAQIMALDNLADARVAAIEGLADLKTEDPRVIKLLVDSMEHEDPAIRFASLNALKSLTGKNLGTDVVAWRDSLKSVIDDPEAPKTVTAPAPADNTPKTAGAPAPTALNDPSTRPTSADLPVLAEPPGYATPQPAASPAEELPLMSAPR